MCLGLLSKIIINGKVRNSVNASFSVMGISSFFLVALEESVVSKIIFAGLGACILLHVGQEGTRVDSSNTSWAVPCNNIVELSCEGYLELVVWRFSLPNHCSELLGNKCWITKTSVEVISCFRGIPFISCDIGISYLGFSCCWSKPSIEVLPAILVGDWSLGGVCLFLLIV